MTGWNFEKYFSPSYWRQIFGSPRTIGGKISKLVRVVIGSIRGFNDDECSDKASALTFYTLLSIIPVLAVAFGIAKGFGFEHHLESEVMLRFSDQPEIASKLIAFADNMLKNAQSGLIAGVGLGVLLWSVLKLMSNIESSFNAIWKVKTPRSWPRRVSDYLAMMLFCPIFFAVSSSITVFITSQVMDLSQTSDMWKALSPFVLFIFHLFPLLLSWVLFTALYYVMPNAKVPLYCAAVAGLIAGTSYQIMQWIYLKFAIGLASYGAIYGSFAALPLFLLWLNTSWLIALAGAEIAYHAENDMPLVSNDTDVQKPVDARMVGLLIMKQAVDAFSTGATPPSVYNFARATGIAVMPVKQLVHQLINAGLLVEVTWRNGTTGVFQPARDVSKISVQDVCASLDTSRLEHYIINYNSAAQGLADHLISLDTALQHSEVNTPLDKLFAARISADGA